MYEDAVITEGKSLSCGVYHYLINKDKVVAFPASLVVTILNVLDVVPNGLVVLEAASTAIKIESHIDNNSRGVSHPFIEHPIQDAHFSVR